MRVQQLHTVVVNKVSWEL